MTEAEWLASENPQAMLRFLADKGRATDRKLLLFTAACCRHHWDLLNEVSRSALEGVERKADGPWSRQDGFRAYDDAEEGFERTCEQFGYFDDPYGPESPANIRWAGILGCAVEAEPTDAAGLAVGMAAEQEQEWQARLLRDIFPPPFETGPFANLELRAAVTTFAQAIYEERAFDRLPILADALEEAGCTDATILTHLRGPGPHVCGCWVIDLLRGKE